MGRFLSVRGRSIDRNERTSRIDLQHRFASIAKTDKIIILNNGKISDIGSHDELMKYPNWYKEQYIKQIKGDRNEKY